MGILPHEFCLLIKSIVQLCYIFVIEHSVDGVVRGCST